MIASSRPTTFLSCAHRQDANGFCEVVLHPQQEEAPSDIKLEITGRDAGRIIGKKGQVLSAIQFLCNRVVSRPAH